MKWNLRDYQTHAVDQSVRFLMHGGTAEQGGLVVLPTGCLVGSTVVFTNRAGNGRRQTLETIYRAQTAYASRRKSEVVAYTRSFDGNRVGLHPFDSVQYSGVRPTWELTLTDGTILRGTADHRIFTQMDTLAHFVPLSELKPGQEVLCDSPRPVGVGRNPKIQYAQIQGLRYHPYAGATSSYRARGTHVEGRLYRVPYHRLVVEADMNGLDLQVFIALCRTDEGRSASLEFLDPDEWAVHHRDHDVSNNARSNLQILTHEAHGRLHSIHTAANFGQGVPRLVSVASVRETGQDEDVYDLMACAPYQNFVANGIVVHNSGKSLVIAGVVQNLNGPCLIFQPSREILEQNANKLYGYGYEPQVFSASMGTKDIGAITLATIGSVKNVPHLFDHFPYVMVDEAHLVNAKAGMYKEFFEALGGVRIIGLTATPYRLNTDGYGGSMLKFLTRTRPRVFGSVLSYAQISTLMEQGYLVQPEYQIVSGFNSAELKTNSTGADYSDESVKRYYKRIGFNDRVRRVVERTLAVGRKHVLVFTRFVDEAEAIAKQVSRTAVVSANTKPSLRAAIIKAFRAGEIQCVANVGVLTLGFDFPELDTVVLARPTLSLGVYYQQVGRLLRPSPMKKDAWVVDMVDQVRQFGRIEDLWLQPGGVTGEKWEMVSRTNGVDKVLTNKYYGDGKFKSRHQPKPTQASPW